jgi:hypothetical protein
MKSKTQPPTKTARDILSAEEINTLLQFFTNPSPTLDIPTINNGDQNTSTINSISRISNRKSKT